MRPCTDGGRNRADEFKNPSNEITERVRRRLRSSLQPGAAADVVQAVRGIGGEGVIAKRKASTYQPGERSGDWVKLKLERQQEFVIGGYRPDGSDGLDALRVGYYAGRELLFAGRSRLSAAIPLGFDGLTNVGDLRPPRKHWRGLRRCTRPGSRSAGYQLSPQ